MPLLNTYIAHLDTTMFTRDVMQTRRGDHLSHRESFADLIDIAVANLACDLLFNHLLFVITLAGSGPDEGGIPPPSPPRKRSTLVTRCTAVTNNRYNTNQTFSIIE